MSDDEKGDVPEYKVGKKVGLNDLLKQDQDDESLRKYKESLLGNIDESAARMYPPSPLPPFPSLTLCPCSSLSLRLLIMLSFACHNINIAHSSQERPQTRSSERNASDL